MQKFIPALACASALILGCAPRSAAATEPAAGFAIALFIHACLPNIGHPENTALWATQQHLGEIKDPGPLKIFVGDGTDGLAWGVPAAAGSFALSIRATTHACAVWAKVANPDEVQADFKRIVDSVKRPGVDVTVADDSTIKGSAGPLHQVVYQVWGAGRPTRLLMTSITAEHAGGPFQASLQVAEVAAPVP